MKSVLAKLNKWQESQTLMRHAHLLTSPDYPLWVCRSRWSGSGLLLNIPLVNAAGEYKLLLPSGCTTKFLGCGWFLEHIISRHDSFIIFFKCKDGLSIHRLTTLRRCLHPQTSLPIQHSYRIWYYQQSS